MNMRRSKVAEIIAWIVTACILLFVALLYYGMWRSDERYLAGNKRSIATDTHLIASCSRGPISAGE